MPLPSCIHRACQAGPERPGLVEVKHYFAMQKALELPDSVSKSLEALLLRAVM